MTKRFLNRFRQVSSAGGGAPPVDLEAAAIAAAAATGGSLWYIKPDLSNTFSDTGGTTPSVNGGPIARINDANGLFNVTQATGAAQPLVTLIAAGKYGMLFDGTDDFMASSHSVAAPVGETLIVGFQRGATGTADTIISRTNAGGTQGTIINITNADVWRYQNQAGVTTTVNLSAAAGSASLVLTGTSTGTSQVGRTNGVQVGTGAGTFTPAAVAVNLGINGSGVQPTTGIIALAFYAPVVLSLAQIQAIEAYAAYKINITI